MQIRERQPADLPACVDLLSLVHAADNYPLRWPSSPADWLTPAGMLAAFVARSDNELVGHIAAVADIAVVSHPVPDAQPGLAELTRLFVSPLTRHHGVGAALTDAVIAHAADLGRALFLQVVEDRSGTAEFYERQGWLLVGRQLASWTTPAGNHPMLRKYQMPFAWL